MAKMNGFPSGKNLRVMAFSVAFGNTTAFEAARLPKGARIVGFLFNAKTAWTTSGDRTSVVVSLGSTSSANEYHSGVQVLGGAAGEVGTAGGYAGAKAAAVLTANQNPVYAKVAASGGTTGAANAGESIVWVLYTDGNDLFDQVA